MKSGLEVDVVLIDVRTDDFPYHLPHCSMPVPTPISVLPLASSIEILVRIDLTQGGRWCTDQSSVI